MVSLKLDLYTKRQLGPDETFVAEDLKASIKKSLMNYHLNANQKLLVESGSNVFLCQVTEVDAVNVEELTNSPSRTRADKQKYGRMVENTLILLKSDNLPILSDQPT